MGYSCTTAALRTLQTIKEMCGRDLEASNEVVLSGRRVFFERGDEQDDGAIVGTLNDSLGLRRPCRFRIDADGGIRTFPGFPGLGPVRRKVEALVRCSRYQPRPVAVI